MFLRFAVLVSVAVLLSAIESAWADDLYPPPWRGEDRSLTATWEFEDVDIDYPSSIDEPADFYTGPFSEPHVTGYLYQPYTTIYPDGYLVVFYYPEIAAYEISSDDLYALEGIDVQDRTGVVELGNLDFTLENYPDPAPTTEARIQLTWLPTIMGGTIISDDPFEVDIGFGSPPKIETWSSPTQASSIVLVNEERLDDGWMHSVYDITFDGNPSSETFAITGGSWLDEVIIDTHSVPEPCAPVLAIFAGFVVLLRRRQIVQRERRSDIR